MNRKSDVEDGCFELYCQHGGSIPEMLRSIALWSLEERRKIPSQATLYRYEKELQWKQRYNKIASAALKDMEKEVAMTYKRINTLASLAMYGIQKRLAQAIEKDDYTVFTPSLLETIWRMQRTERGLPSSVTQANQEEKNPADAILDSMHEQNPIFAKAMEKMTPEWIERMSAELGMNADLPPSLIERR